MVKKVLVVDDSALMRRVISDIINKTSDFVVGYTAADGSEALGILRTRADVDVTICDVNMPKMNGLELLEIVVKSSIDVPFVIFSSTEDASETIRALELGAIDFIKKPEKIFSKDNKRFEEKVYNALCSAIDSRGKTKFIHTVDNSFSSIAISETSTNKLVAIVCSTGGPKALHSVVPFLPPNLAAPVVIVQHMPFGFTLSMAQRLDELSKIRVCEVNDGDVLTAGTVYIAKGGKHLILSNDKSGVTAVIDDSPAVVGLKPCGNLMYESLSQLPYDEIVCVVMTGMGADGTNGIKALKNNKNIYVIAQNEETSTVYGMPKAIYEAGLTDEVCGLTNIAGRITRKVGVL